jgi:hypothetical protein
MEAGEPRLGVPQSKEEHADEQQRSNRASGREDESETPALFEHSP